MQESADKLLEAYPQDLEVSLRDELPQFSEFVKNIDVDCSSLELKCFMLIKKNNLDTTRFPTSKIRYVFIYAWWLQTALEKNHFQKWNKLKTIYEAQLGERGYNIWLFWILKMMSWNH